MNKKLTLRCPFITRALRKLIKDFYQRLHRISVLGRAHMVTIRSDQAFAGSAKFLIRKSALCNPLLFLNKIH